RVRNEVMINIDQDPPDWSYSAVASLRSRYAIAATHCSCARPLARARTRMSRPQLDAAGHLTHEKQRVDPVRSGSVELDRRVDVAEHVALRFAHVASSFRR